MYCTKCGKELVDNHCPNCENHLFCPYCQTLLTDGKCMQCGYESTDEICPRCGKHISSGEPHFCSTNGFSQSDFEAFEKAIYERKVRNFTIIGLIASFLVPVAGLVFAIISLNMNKNVNNKLFRFLAILAIIISVTMMIYSAIEVINELDSILNGNSFNPGSSGDNTNTTSSSSSGGTLV